MSGRYVRLKPGRYTLSVSAGEGPAGVRRGEGMDVRVEVGGGCAEFWVSRREDVYYWWRGPAERSGVRLVGDPPSEPGTPVASREENPEWPKATAG